MLFCQKAHCVSRPELSLIQSDKAQKDPEDERFLHTDINSSDQTVQIARLRSDIQSNLC